ncbi:hypothetical protein SSX86_029378 [Deinandra increscens subsp. villosa]|uniref:Subtilisin-like protease n=1 Tax=Deinandra increscens subsp. villosa TaxID=3103831 RepID=A0AAP0CG37_9ASTR
MNSFRLLLLAFFIALCTLHSSSFAAKSKKSYIVYFGGVNQELEASQIQDSHSKFLGSILGSKERADEAMIYSYNKQFNGFAAMLHEEDATTIAEHPDVATVIQSKGRKLHTTHSWDFLKLEKNGFVGPSSLWSKARFGENIIIANLDTGVWPESKSFSPDGYGPIPSKWKGGCENDTLVPCNNKLIGAKYYNKGYEARSKVKMDPSMNNPRDHNGHGSHTLSTAGGNFVPGVSVNGIVVGTAKGGSPRARVAAYKVCWPPTPQGGECEDADIVKGLETAIHDGVDVISASIGLTPADYMDDGVAIASFHAVQKGITVVFSAGNDGPVPGTVSNVAPWVITVGASTIDREFQSFVELANGLNLKVQTSYPYSTRIKHVQTLAGFWILSNLIYGANAKAENATVMNATLCAQGALDPKKVQGKILVCLIGGNVYSGTQAALAGAAGMILCNDKAHGDQIIPAAHVLPATFITYADGLRLYAYLDSTKEPLGYITRPEAAINIKPAPIMAGFSSRGPNPVTPDILKPDITAPGVDIIAAVSEDKKPVLPYDKMSGTSMSCPHVAGVVGLLKSLHPDWSPSAIKSAIMTTATVKDNRRSVMLDETKNEANPFSRGAGHINPNRAMNPGLVYDLTANDYLDFLCTRGYNETVIQKFSDQPYKCPENNSILDFNYPSITVYNLNGTVTVTRRLTNVGPPGTYTAGVKSPVGISVEVKPNILAFGKKGEVQKFELTMKADGTSVIKDYVFGELVWSNGKHFHVKSPIVVSVA